MVHKVVAGLFVSIQHDTASIRVAFLVPVFTEAQLVCLDMEEASSGNIQSTLRDILDRVSQQSTEFKKYVDGKVAAEIGGISAQFQGANFSVAAEVKKLKAERDFNWKREGNKIQFLFNADVADIVKQAAWAVENNKEDYVLELLRDIDAKLKQRNKLIKLADSSEAGWETVRQYESNPIASDSEDESRIVRAETRALRKRKRNQEKFGAKKTAPWRFGNSGPTSTFTRPVMGPFGVSGVQGQGANQFGAPFPVQRLCVCLQSAPGTCFACGAFDHYRRDCPFNRPISGSAEGSKQK